MAASFAHTFNMKIDEARRWFEGQTGLSLDAVIDHCRIDFARKLVVETNLPIETIADLATCSGVREFEEAFERRFRQSPGTLRKDRVQDGSTIELTLPYRPPLDWQGVLNFARYHQIRGLEAVDEVSYRRFFTIGEAQGLFRVTNDPKKPQLKLEIEVDDPAVIFTVVQRVRRMFDLDSDLLAIGECFGKHETLGPLWESRPGLRIARGWDPFETAVLTILGQLVSTRQARALVGQLVEACGTRSANPIAEDIPYLFPDAETLAHADLAPIRTSPARKRAIQELSRAVVSGSIDLDDFRDIQGVKERLLGLAGIGPWTAEYIGLRALGDPDSFPRTDLVIKRAFETHPGLDLDGVRPWRGYMAVCLWSHFAKPATP
ncbi:AlkA N-terminal domain-containing protein [Singulisphaera sp. PoT]|uniref:DNA-3-methyladenine glycosylase 2 n=1 Tax=Singulisphaera sp. PoT TaxID=3411797 RepID=UPI003BF4E3F9